MAKNKKKSKKSKPRKQKTPKEVSKLEKIKKYESDLYLACMETISNVSKQTGLSEEDILKFIAKNGIDKIKIMKGLMIAEPIFLIIKRNWELLAKIKIIREKMESNTRVLFINEMEEEVAKLDQEVKKIEQEKTFYHKVPDKEGKIELKDKWFTEMTYWQEQLAKSKSVEEYKTAQREITKLKAKKNSMHLKNIAPNITKYSRKFSGWVNTIQDSMGEIAKPFQDMSDETGFSDKKKAKPKSNDYGFNEGNVFKGTPQVSFGQRTVKSKSKKYDDPMGGFDI